MPQQASNRWISIGDLPTRDTFRIWSAHIGDLFARVEKLEGVRTAVSTPGPKQSGIYPGLTAQPTFTKVTVSSGSATPLNIPVLTADPGTLANGDVWLYDNAGTRQIRVRMGGVTYGTTVT